MKLRSWSGVGMTQKIEISYRTIVFTILFLIFLWLLFQIRHILIILFVGTILMSALNPLVNRLEKLKIPRALAAILIYLAIFIFLVLVLATIIPAIISQTGILVSHLPDYFRYFNLPPIDGEFLNNQINQLLTPVGSFSLGVIRTTLGILSNFVVIFTLIFVSFYLLLERKHLDEYLLKLFGPVGAKKAALIFDKIEKRLGEWVRAQVSLMLIVGVMCYIGLVILGIDFALPLALLAGILEIVPNIGPVLSAVPAILIGLGITPLMGLAVAALYFLVQQVENQIIVPQVMRKEAGVNPLVTILALIAGFKVGGAAGAVLSIPFVILLEILIAEFLASKKA